MYLKTKWITNKGTGNTPHPLPTLPWGTTIGKNNDERKTKERARERNNGNSVSVYACNLVP
jgi:hypothetical protein